MTEALVLFSGGQDSTTCLAWALERFERVSTIGFDYGQRHRVELDCRAPIREALAACKPQWAARLGEDYVLPLPTLGTISDTALTRERAITFSQNNLPSTFVPGRNLLFFTYAAALAYRQNIQHLVGGMCETDYSGYPDCRDQTIKALQEALSLGMDYVFTIDTPLMWLDKKATWQMARELGGETLTTIVCDMTHSCYLGDRTMRHDWGYGCGACPACHLRSAGYFKAHTYAKKSD